MTPGNPLLRQRTVYTEAARGNLDRARTLFHELRETESGFWRRSASGGLALLAQAEGKLDEAERFHRETGMNDIGYLQWMSRVQLLTNRDLEQAAVLLDQFRAALSQVPPENQPYLLMAGLYARTGQPDRAREMLAAWEEYADESSRSVDRVTRLGLEGLTLLAEERHSEAIRYLRSAHQQTDRSPLAYLPDLGEAYQRLPQPDSAIAVYERYPRTPYYNHLGVDALWLPVVYWRLASIYEESGDTAKAIDHYSRFAELWKDCDPELRPHVEAAQTSIARLESGGT